MPRQVVFRLANAIASKDALQVDALLARDVVATCAGLEDLCGRRLVSGYWSRIFDRWSLIELHLGRTISDDAVVIAESGYLAARLDETPFWLQGHLVIEIHNGLIERWTDHYDLDQAPRSEIERLQRWRRARW